MKNSNDTIGNRTCDVPVCSAVPQPTAPPRAPWWHRLDVISVSFLVLEVYQHKFCPLMHSFLMLYCNFISCADIYHTEALEGKQRM
jgi:hypothetical protein